MIARELQYMSADAALNLLKKGKQQTPDTLQSLIPLIHTLGVINPDLSLDPDLVTMPRSLMP